ncbi:MAG TPA: SH3 domain-containing protein [Anaerolineales bacterium]
MKKLVLHLMLLSLVAAGCATSKPAVTPFATPSPSPVPSQTPTPSATIKQPAFTPTSILIDGTLIFKVNVRSGPGTTYDSLGQLEAGSNIQVTARDSAGAWYQILFPNSPNGHGWVAAQFVTIAPGTVVPLDATPTPAGPTGRVIQRLNVRSGPGTAFDSLGLIEPGVAVSLTGKNTTASWFQIVYPAGPGGRGWVTSQYVQTDAASDLPVIDDFGNIVTPGAAGTPSGPGTAPTPTVGPAIADGDSSASPAVRVTFSAIGTTRFVFSSQVSAPQGDGEDWVEFTPFSNTETNAQLMLSLTCTGNDDLTVDLWQGDKLLSEWGNLACGDTRKTILLPAGRTYLMSLAPLPGDGLRLVAYILTVQNDP